MTAANDQLLRAIEKLNPAMGGGVTDLLMEGRRDESGAFTSGAGLSNGQAAALYAHLTIIDAALNPWKSDKLAIARRFVAMVALDTTVTDPPTERTAWDDMLSNRPPDLALALDEAADYLEARLAGQPAIRPS